LADFLPAFLIRGKKATVLVSVPFVLYSFCVLCGLFYPERSRRVTTKNTKYYTKSTKIF